MTGCWDQDIVQHERHRERWRQHNWQRRQRYSYSDVADAYPIVEVGADPPVTYLYNSDMEFMK